MANNAKQPLFSEFPPVTTQDWMNKINADLKGADFEKKLVWKTNEGFNVNPFYRNEDLKNINHLDSLPGEFPYVRGTDNSNNWLVRQDIVVNKPKEANQKALELTKKGVNSIGFIFENKELLTSENIKILLNGLISETIELNFSTSCESKKLMLLLVDEFQTQGVDAKNIRGSINVDPIGKLTIGKKFCDTLEKRLESAVTITKSNVLMPNFQTIGVNGQYFGNCGSTIVQELAFSLAIGNEYMSKLTEGGISSENAAKSIKFTLSIGSNYFPEIAKLRAARLLWAAIVNEYKPAHTDACKMKIHCQTSDFNMTLFDPYVNLLRSQTEAMSATLGGCNSLTITPFNNHFAETNEFSERIARNQQLLLKEESYFDKVVDPGAGCYYIESLTDSIANEAWKLFIDIENRGGYIAAFKEGFIQNLIKASAEKRLKDVSSRKEILLGTNQFPNILEKSSNTLLLNKLEESEFCSDYEPIKPYRVSEQFETLRLATEKSGKCPKVFMLTYGNLAMRLARSQFSGNFFGCAGYEIIDNLGFETIEEGVESALKANADIVVLCSSDDEYPVAAPLAFEKLKGKAIFVVAGAPVCTEELKEKGIDNFINIRSNVLDSLTGFQKKLGII
ncbi:MAG: methylmalonyl-CoA mutase family protein [Marinilabiliaceae bacterium]|nr:methylmalonyl-CoA mutase family protein [Marinilabiliaceae bacterium]